MGCTGEVNLQVNKMRGSLQLLPVNEARLFFGFFWFVYFPVCLPLIYIHIKHENSGFYSTSDVLHLNAIT